MVIIGLVGYAGAGKDTAADALPEFERVAFADPLRTAAGALFALDTPMPPERKTEPGPTGVSYRRGLQVLGTDVVRDQFSALFPELKWPSDEHWINLLKTRLDPAKDYIVTDVRFPNEAEAIKKWGGMIVGIHRHAADSDDPHPSETGVAEITQSKTLVQYLIYNDSTIEELHAKMHDVADIARGMQQCSALFTCHH